MSLIFKLAVIADVHSNVAALDAVLTDIAKRGADMIVNLGDIASGPLHPAETAERLMQLDLPTVRGNHERQLATLPAHAMGLSDRFAHDRLSSPARDWIAALPERLLIDDDILLIHGAPESDLAYLLETVTPEGCRQATEAEVEHRLMQIDARLILCGHTHLPRATHLKDGRLVVNPGSVGLPAYEGALPFSHRNEAGSPHARYALLQRKDGGWDVEFVAVDYDWAAMSRLADARGREDWRRALATGRV